MSLFAAQDRASKRDSMGDPLQMLDRHIDFGAIAAAVDAKLKLGDRGRGGRPPYATETMVRLLVLQQLYNLSDAALEYQVLDRSSFVRFARLTNSSRVPDAKTRWVWRERLKKNDLIGDISAAVSEQLQDAGFTAKGGQIIDASIVSAPIQRNTREENAAVKAGETPSDWSQAKRSQKDVDARWTRKNNKCYYGYKLHANVDRQWGFIRHAQVTTASVIDTTVFEALLDPNTGQAIYADRGYPKATRERALREKGYRVHIQHKGERNKPLREREHQRNHLIAKRRAYVEHAFARLHQLGGKFVRTIGLARAKVQLGLKVATHNLQRLARLLDRGAVPA